ncbi:hypothetical protein FRC07_014830 [Ceratobasidium sp. 392]|nr:hypothetical protein FRC07_014830 [Ceratobasidium sp. 392]
MGTSPTVSHPSTLSISSHSTALSSVLSSATSHSLTRTLPASSALTSSTNPTATSSARPTVTVIVTPSASSSSLVSAISSTSHPVITRTFVVFPSHSFNTTSPVSTSTPASPTVTVITRYGTTTSTRVAPVSTSTLSTSTVTTSSFVRPTVTVIVTPKPSSTPISTTSSVPPVITRTFVVFPSHNSNTTSLASTSTLAPPIVTVITRYGTITSTRAAAISSSTSPTSTTSFIRPTVTVIVTPTPSTSIPTISNTSVSTTTAPPFTRTLFVFPSLLPTSTSTSTPTPRFTVITRYGTTTSARMISLPTGSTSTTTTFVRPTVTVIVTPTPTSTPRPVITRTFIVFPSQNTTSTVPVTTPVRPTVTVIVVPVPAPTPSTVTTTSTIVPNTVWVTLLPTSTSSLPITRTFFVPSPPPKSTEVTIVISHSITTRTIVPFITTSTAFATVVTTMKVSLPPPSATPSVHLAPVVRSDSTVIMPSLVPTVSVSATTVTQNVTLAPVPTVSVSTRTIKTTITGPEHTILSTIIATPVTTKLLTIVTPTTVTFRPRTSVSVVSFRHLDISSTSSDLLTLTTPPPEPTDIESNLSYVNKGAIAGGVVGGVAGVILLLGLLILLVRRYRRKQNGRSMRIGSSTALERGIMLADPPGDSFIEGFDSHILGALPGLEQNLPKSTWARSDIIEIQGSAASGKTHLLYFWAMTCILPYYTSIRAEGSEKAFEVLLGGRNKSVVVCDCDARWSLLRLHTIISRYLHERLASAISASQPNEDSEMHGAASAPVVSEVVSEALKRVHIFRPTSTLSLATTLISIPVYHRSRMSDETIGMLMIDSISSFYWSDRWASEQLEKSSQAPDDLPPDVSKTVALQPQPLRSDVNPLQHVLTVVLQLRRSLGMVTFFTNWGLTTLESQLPSSITYFRQHLRAPYPSPFDSESSRSKFPLMHHITIPQQGLPPFDVATPLEEAANDQARKELSERLRLHASVRTIAKRPGEANAVAESEFEFVITNDGVLVS